MNTEREALAELVRLQDMRDRADKINPVEPGCEKEVLMDLWRQGQRSAWAKARAALAKKPALTAPESGTAMSTQKVLAEPRLITTVRDLAHTKLALYNAEQMHDYAVAYAAALAEKPAQTDQQRVDAERYRWLRDFAAASIYVSQPFICGAGDLALSGAAADSAVDAAILAAQEKP